MGNENPLLVTTGLPRFDLVQPEHVVPGVRQVLAEAEQKVKVLEENLAPTWEGLLKPLEEMDLPFEYAWSPLGHLLGVKNSETLREAHEEVLPEVVAFSLRAQQSQQIYRELKAFREGEAWDGLDEGQKRVVELRLRAAEHSGVGLEGEAKERFNEIVKELSQIKTDFSNHVLDATKAFELILRDPDAAEGWPQSLREVAAQSYHQSKKEDDASPEAGPWSV
jgi:oligopeptidase A